MPNLKNILLCCLLTSMYSVFAVTYKNVVNSPNIKTVQLFPKGADMAMPIINMNANEKLELHFDDLSNTPKQYYYTVIQCQSDWTPTTMNQMEYIDGFTEANITDYDYSEGTTIPYIHYTLEFPNKDMNIKLSGNYVLIVYDYDIEQPIFIKRFMLTEAKVQIDANVAYTRSLAQRDKLQEVVFKVNYETFAIDNPQMEIKATVLQNYRWDNAKENIKPRFSGIKELDFDLNGVLTFPSLGREFRYFDIRSLRFRGQNVRAFDIQEHENNVYLLYDRPTGQNKYQLVADLNGQYYIENLDNPYYNTGADYANVHFDFDAGGKLSEGDFYVVGAFNNWTCNEQSKMYYDVLDKSYALNVLLKQGIYNYTYLYKQNANANPDPYLAEGYYYDTENDYTILLYYTPFGERYDRLIAVKHINSIKNRL
ncbi:MAG: DUF5103 domain-containing protein [Bacteroidetes bacterium]|nr:DUF5103 domain-containing protein [Bacteroidota bacterium]